MLYILILKLPWNMKVIECGMCNYGFESCLFLPESNNLTDKQLCFSGQQHVDFTWQSEDILWKNCIQF